MSNLYYNDVQPQVAARLDALLGGGGRVFFANSGAEANECAIKLARRYGQAHGGPERYHVLSAYGSFHGRTLTTLAATGQPQKQETFQPLPAGFRQVAFADLDALAAAMDERVCAVLLEPVQGEGGRAARAAGYLEAVRALCDEREALLIIDEVQTGLGRTGRWFGFEHAGVRGPTSSRWPRRSATACRSARAGPGPRWPRAFRPGDHATTFGGQPLAARAALAVLDVMEAEDVPARAPTAGARLTGARGAPGRRRRAGLGPAARRRARPGIDAGDGRRRVPRGRARRQRRSPRPRCGSRRRCS